MGVPEDIRAVKRPVNTVVVDTGRNGIKRYAVRERNGAKCIPNHNPQPYNGKIIGYIIDHKYVAVKENILYTTISERLKLLRSLNKQGEFAKFLDIPQSTLSAYEKGKIKPSITALVNIADKCEVSLDWLCGRE